MPTESLLEMYFHRPLVELFEAHYGRHVLRLIKPSQRQERFLGFDQAWTLRTTQTNDEFMHDIAAKVRLARAGKYTGRFVGYFLQFKSGQIVQRRSRYTPSHMAGGAARFELYTQPTGDHQWPWSQHETLARLQSALGSRGEVSYACPMLFGDVDVFLQPSLDDLHIVPLASAPLLGESERHFIYFDHRARDPWWCSEAVRASKLRPSEWVSRVARASETNGDLLEDLERVRAVFSERRGRDSFRFPRQLTILELAPA